MKNKKFFRRTMLSVLLLLITITLMACGNSNEEGSSIEASTASQNYDPELIAEGEETVKTSCILCHGRDLKGDMGPSLFNLQLTEEEIREILVKGKGSMPPIIANGKEDAVIAYLMTLKNSD